MLGLRLFGIHDLRSLLLHGCCQGCSSCFALTCFDADLLTVTILVKYDTFQSSV